MSPEMKNIIDKAVSQIGIQSVIHALVQGRIKFNLKETESDIEVMDYLNDLLIKERDQKLSSILSERKIFTFTEFTTFQ